jgi:hypothetical protein
METAVAAYALTSRERLERFFAMPVQDYYDELLQYFYLLCESRGAARWSETMRTEAETAARVARLTALRKSAAAGCIIERARGQ